MNTICIMKICDFDDINHIDYLVLVILKLNTFFITPNSTLTNEIHNTTIIVNDFHGGARPTESI